MMDVPLEQVCYKEKGKGTSKSELNSLKAAGLKLTADLLGHRDGQPETAACRKWSPEGGV